MSDNDNRKLIQPSLEIQIHGLAPSVTVHKSMCPIHSEAKRMAMSEFWANKGLLQERIRRTGGLCSKKSQTPWKVSAKHFQRPGKGEESKSVKSVYSRNYLLFMLHLKTCKWGTSNNWFIVLFFTWPTREKSVLNTRWLVTLSQWFLQHVAFLLKSSVLSRRDQCQSSSPKGGMAQEEEVRSNSTTCLYQLWSWISLLKDCSGGLST